MSFTKNNKTILVAPLDWGLGHATRCIPIIGELQEQGCTVFIGASGAHASLLQQEFPTITILPLQGYNIRYGNGNLILQLIRQLPAFIKTMNAEKRWLATTIENHQIDAVISDNRYGMFSAKVPSVLITHQLQVQIPAWMKWSERLVQKRLYGFIQQFAECWVPDNELEKSSIGRKLSYPAKMPSVPTHYIGWLTRFQPQAFIVKKREILISLSGPEPQRTILEKMLLNQLNSCDEKVLLIRGLPGATETIKPEKKSISITNHLPGNELQRAILESEIFISRCGYSTLMDLQTASCKCIFIPTPGQTEQEYLGEQIKASGKAVVMQQREFNLQNALQQAASLPPFSAGNYSNIQLEKTIKHWLATLP